jgi:hypothetical protein
MSDSMIIYLDRNNNFQIIDPDCVPHSDGINPLQHIVIDVINAGYEGVAIDEKKLANGRYFQIISVNETTPEGQILSILSKNHQLGKSLPASRSVLQQIQAAYGIETPYKRSR